MLGPVSAVSDDVRDGVAWGLVGHPSSVSSAVEPHDLMLGCVRIGSWWHSVGRREFGSRVDRLTLSWLGDVRRKRR